MTDLKLDIYGVGILISGYEKTLFKLGKDFSYFKRDFEGRGDYRIHIEHTKKVDYSLIPEDAEPIFTHPEFFMYQSGEKKCIDYCGRGISVYDPRDKQIRLYSPDKDLQHEIAYLAVISSAGELLEKRGYFRAHGMGVKYGEKTAIMLGSSGMGKTRLFLGLLKDPDVSIYSDDILLLDKKRNLFPFPLRIGVKAKSELPEGIDKSLVYEMNRRKYGKKILLDTSAFSDRIAPPSQPSTILIASRWNSEGFKYRPASRIKVFRMLIRDMGIGYGLPQLMEYMNLSFKLSGFPGILIRGFRRLILIFSLSLSGKAYYIYLGRDSDKNTQGLIDLLEKT
ncbi:MAG: hypothetical protein GX817_04255 [Elusimicrobia bacterium]|nr:hypothetical protein [Elusimicrobiota bacterium]